MPLFCKTCNNLLSSITRADTFYFKCVSCKETYQPEPEDTLRFEEIKGTNLSIYKTLLHHAGEDPVNPKIYTNCTKCGNNIAKYVQLGDDMRQINICTNCYKQWIEGLDTDE